jgi:hypothetical protein
MGGPEAVDLNFALRLGASHAQFLWRIYAKSILLVEFESMAEFPGQIFVLFWFSSPGSLPDQNGGE